MTEKLYYTDSYQQEFTGTLLERAVRQGRTTVVLDRTCFYPVSGGQPHDCGWLAGVKVVDVVEEGERVLHFLDGKGPEVGATVEGKIDWKRRFEHMQQHTGQHILSQTFFRLLGCHTESFHLGAEISTIDLSREELTTEEIYQAEDLANQVVFENRPIDVHFIDSKEQDQLPIRKLSSLSGQLRIVEVAEFDWSPCGGTHCQRTGEVGVIKVRRWERVKKQARVSFYCGWRALQDYRWKNRAIYRLSRLYRRADCEVVEAAEEHFEREQSLREKLENTQDVLLDAEAERLVRDSQERKGTQVICDVLDKEKRQIVEKLAQKVVEGSSDRLLLLGVRGERPTLIFACSKDLPHDMAEWIRVAAPFIHGRGGGHSRLARAGGTREKGLSSALKKALTLL